MNKNKALNEHRLIDTRDLNRYIALYHADKPELMDGLLEVIDEIPTAYDIQGIVEQLEELFYCNEQCQKKFYQGLGCKACLFGKVKEIIKGNYCENGNSSEGGKG